MQALPVAATGPSYPALIPGPFILLLLLPIIPLLLFSVGARPPDTSGLPFSTDDLWQTTAFISVAGAVVLCVGLYPGAFSDVAQWVADGGTGEIGSWWQEFRGAEEPRAQDPRSRITHHAQYQQGLAQGQFQHSSGGHHGHARRPAVNRNGRPVLRAPANQMPRAAPQYVSQGSLAARHVAALREGMAPWYNPARPSPHIPLLVTFITAALLIVILGKVLGSAYDADAKSSSRSSSLGSSRNAEDWPSREMRKRKNEKEADTKARVEREVKEWKEKLGKMSSQDRAKAMEKRKKEVGLVKKELEKRKLSTKGLELYLGSSKGKDDAKDKEGKKDNDDKQKGKHKGGTSPREKTKTSNKIKGFFLGPPGSAMRSKNASAEEGSKTKLFNGVPAQGPGWKAADDAVAHAAIRGGAARAEELGNQLVAQKKA